MARGESRRDLLNEPAEESEMTRLMLILFSMASTTLMGIAIVIALTMGLDTLQPILVAAALGFVAAIPVSWLLARRLS
jgi:predicted PurR-regulated permease PerM